MLSFDTHQFYNRLTQNGFTKNQAEVVTDLIKETQEKSFEKIASQLVNKEEFNARFNDLEKKISQTESKIEQTRNDLEKKSSKRKVI